MQYLLWICQKGTTFLLKKDNLIIGILIGVLLLVIAWPVENENSQKTTDSMDTMSGLWNSKNAIENTRADMGSYSGNDAKDKTDISNQLEARLEEILSVMEGVGKVKVMITLASTGEKVIEKDTPTDRSNITEQDSTGGSRNTSEMNAQESTVYISNSQGEKIPYVVKEISPVVEGVSVVAQGGGDFQVQKNITEVIQALFGIEVHKIKVVKMKQQE